MPATQVVRIPFAQEPATRPLTVAYAAVANEAGAAAAWLRRVRCGLAGHEMMLQFEPGKLSLRCHGCGHETPGWSVG